MRNYHPLPVAKRHNSIRAVEERSARTPGPRTPEEQAVIDALFERLRQMPVLDDRAPDEIIGYGDDGLPS